MTKEERKGFEENFLSKVASEDLRDFYARYFRIQNAEYEYWGLAFSKTEEDLRKCYKKWLQILPPVISADIKKSGFKNCKKNGEFAQYVNEVYGIKKTIWMESHLSEDDYKYFEETDDKPTIEEVIRFTSVEELIKSLEEYSGFTIEPKEVNTRKKLLGRISEIKKILSSEVNHKCSLYYYEVEKLMPDEED